MRIFSKRKDGGPASTVDAYFLIEIKPLFSIALLKFHKGSRENYHSHAFNALTWFLAGDMTEELVTGEVTKYQRKIWPKVTGRKVFHKVYATKNSWCLTLRGPWCDRWNEHNKSTNTTTTLTNNRTIVETKHEVL